MAHLAPSKIRNRCTMKATPRAQFSPQGSPFQRDDVPRQEWGVSLASPDVGRLPSKGEIENKVTAVLMPLIQKYCGFPLHSGRAGLLTVLHSEPHLPRWSLLCGETAKP